MRGFTDVDAGVVDENVDPAKLAPDALDHIGDGPVMVSAGYEDLFHQYSSMHLPRRDARIHAR